MSYFDYTGNIDANTLARASVVDAIFQAIEDSFATLPSSEAIKQASANYLLATGSANTYVATPTTAWTAYAAGQALRVKWPAANTGAATINVSGLGAASIKRIDGTALTSGDINSGGISDVVHDGTDFRLISMHGSDLAATPAQAVAAAASASAASTSASTASTQASAASVSAAAALVSEGAAAASAAGIPDFTISSAAPSGGSNGDIWFVVV